MYQNYKKDTPKSHKGEREFVNFQKDEVTCDVFYLYQKMASEICLIILQISENFFNLCLRL